MPDLRTSVTELVTGLGTLGYPDVDAALAARPAAMASVSPEQWLQLEQARTGGALNAQFETAFANGAALLEAKDGLRGRTPIFVEWKGGHKNPGDDSLPIDLRIDHVFLVSCKYDSRMLHNVAPSRLFDHGLRRTARESGNDWFHEVAGAEYQALYKATVAFSGVADLPPTPLDLTATHRLALKSVVPKVWPETVEEQYAALCTTVASATATRWQQVAETKNAQESMLWRLLRFGQAPYFVLGASKAGPIQLRIATPWDWKQRYVFREMEIAPRAGGQPMVSWHANVRDRHSGSDVDVQGIVEIRWSHGRFQGCPEAKVHLITPHDEVPGYFALA